MSSTVATRVTDVTMTCDVLVLGAGSAGCVVANRLSAEPSREVVVLEAGFWVDDPDMYRPDRWPFNYGKSYDFGYRTAPQQGLDGRELDWPRGKGFGGSSLLNAMAHMRGCRSDFDVWGEETGDSRWSWEGLLPYFHAAEAGHAGLNDPRWPAGPMPVLLPGPELMSPVVHSYLAGWESLGVPRIGDHNHGEMLGATPNTLNIRDGRRVGVADAYLDPIRDRPNLHLVGGAQVHRLIVRQDRIRGAVYAINGHLERVEADTVVLSAGAIADPLLLMRSGIGDPRTLQRASVRTRHKLPGVGRSLHDHLLAAGNVYLAAKPVPHTKLQLSESMTYLSVSGLDRSQGKPDIVVGCVVAASTSQPLRSAVAEVPPGGAYTLLFGVTQPTSRGSVSITGPELEDPPAIDPGYLTTEHDQSLFRTALELARLVGGSGPMSSWRSQELLPGPAVQSPAQVDRFIQRAAITHHHPVGTLRMGAVDDAPVMADLRLRGFDNCWVVDASVIPSITSGPIHAAVLAIAESFCDRFDR